MEKKTTSSVKRFVFYCCIVLLCAAVVPTCAYAKYVFTRSITVNKDSGLSPFAQMPVNPGDSLYEEPTGFVDLTDANAIYFGHEPIRNADGSVSFDNSSDTASGVMLTNFPTDFSKGLTYGIHFYVDKDAHLTEQKTYSVLTAYRTNPAYGMLIFTRGPTLYVRVDGNSEPMTQQSISWEATGTGEYILLVSGFVKGTVNADQINGMSLFFKGETGWENVTVRQYVRDHFPNFENTSVETNTPISFAADYFESAGKYQSLKSTRFYSFCLNTIGTTEATYRSLLKKLGVDDTLADSIDLSWIKVSAPAA